VKDLERKKFSLQPINTVHLGTTVSPVLGETLYVLPQMTCMPDDSRLILRRVMLMLSFQWTKKETLWKYSLKLTLHLKQSKTPRLLLDSPLFA
jgi:hypothetical protein